MDTMSVMQCKRLHQQEIQLKFVILIEDAVNVLLLLLILLLV